MPTIAIETVWISVNHSIVQDEVLAHRIGLIPIKADPMKLDFVEDPKEESTIIINLIIATIIILIIILGMETDTIVFHLDVTCPNPPAEMSEDEKRNFSYKVKSDSIMWHPAGNQENVFPEGVKPVHDDIVITVLRPGQQLEFEAHAVKGIGKDHTKFSPVATASYRLMPDISFSEKIINDRAYELRDMCPLGVFDIEDIKVPGKTEKVPTAIVSRPRDCTMCRECVRKDGWADSVILKRKADHFIFSVESSGCIPATDVVEHAIDILKAKANKFYNLADEYIEA